MKQSFLFTNTRRDLPKDEESTNAKLLIQAGFINKEMAGVYSFLPLGLRVLNKIADIVRKEMEKVGGQEVLMPSLQPKSNWEQTGRWVGFDALFKVKSLINEHEYGLGPTHEEIVVPLVQRFVSSYKDLPLYIYQIQNKFRDEKRSKSGLLRGREFLMKDLYSFHKDEEDLNTYYEQMKQAYKNIFEAVGLGSKTYLTFASGGSFSKYSHEFQTLTEAGEDTVYLCEKCKVAVNEEIIKEQDVCPECGNTNLKQEKGIEVGNIFKLQERFSKPFGLMYKDQDGTDREVLMGCYGIGIGRVMGAIAEVFHDDLGIMWPESVSPAQIHLLSLPGAEKEAEKLYEELQKKGVEVLYDERDATAGEKFADADLIGIPLRVVMSKKTVEKDKLEVKKRNESDAQLMTKDQLLKLVK